MEQAKKIFLVFFVLALIRHFGPEVVSSIQAQSDLLPASLDYAMKILKTNF
ncbi:MAG: hypothetical protein UX26_C0017G0002 [Parcubacteria group bacterium GW2011_GWC1_45_9]|nr:MAG: hypothetical protein UW89_C0021G0012 [Parcubacteria group bacterium GW2011_GWB1_45_10]KKU16743.1 MAG: hypothetical protein UX26_C0017G0002 [Parcubacteria group bacterium GW2011_GWC1_45_9]